MEKYIAILLLLLFSSCITRKKCYERYPPQIITKDSVVVKDTTIFKDTTITLKGDSVTVYAEIPCPEIKKVKTTGKKGNTTVTLTIDKGVVTAKCETDSLNIVIKNLQTKIKTLESYKREVTVVQPPVVNKVPLWLCLVVILLVIIIIFKL